MASTGYVLNTALGPVVSNTSGSGILVDTATPAFGWRDIIGELQIKVAGANDPAWAVYVTNIRQWQFGVSDEIWLDYHIPHDLVPGSDLHIHVHWSHTAATVTGGSVTWGWNLLYAKGHNQAAFPAAMIDTTLVASASTTERQHLISEIQISAAAPSGSQIDSDIIEPDGILKTRFYLSANNITVSGGGVPDPFVHYVDIHYQSTNIATKNKVPNFYT